MPHFADSPAPPPGKPPPAEGDCLTPGLPPTKRRIQTYFLAPPASRLLRVPECTGGRGGGGMRGRGAGRISKADNPSSSTAVAPSGIPSPHWAGRWGGGGRQYAMKSFPHQEGRGPFREKPPGRGAPPAWVGTRSIRSHYLTPSPPDPTHTCSPRLFQTIRAPPPRPAADLKLRASSEQNHTQRGADPHPPPSGWDQGGTGPTGPR